MDRLSMNEMTTYRWSFEEDVRNYAAAGFRAIGVWRQKLSDFGEERGLALLHDSGLEVSSLLWAGGFTGSDGRSFRESVQDAEESIRLAAALHAGCLILYTGSRAGHTHSHARRLMNSALRELAPLAEDFDVTLAVEPMHSGCAADWTFLTGLDDVLSLLDSTGCPHVKLAFDTYHLGYTASILPRLAELASRIAIVQLGDARRPPQGEQDRCRVGDGELPLRQIVCELTDAGYDGYFDVELMGQEIEACDYHELLAQSKAAYLDLVGAQHT
jgi:sugar phosphate isomerase/epimerase